MARESGHDERPDNQSEGTALMHTGDRTIRRVLGLLIVTVVLAGCATAPRIDPLASFHDAQPKSLLVVPIVNNSVDVQAPTSVLTTLPRVLAEKGYYVFPVNTVKTLLEF